MVNETMLESQFLLNMQMLQDDIEDKYPLLYVQHRQDCQKLVGARIYFGQDDLDDAYVYVAPAKIFEIYPIKNIDICRISIGATHRENDVPYPLIEIDATFPWQEVFNAVQAVFQRYLSWAGRLSHILNHGGGLYELCVAAQSFFHNPLYVHDENFNILAMPTWVVGMPQIVVEEGNDNITIPLEKIKQFKENASYIRSLSTHGAQLWISPYGPHRSLYVNVWSRSSQYCGRFLINELNTILKPSHFVMADYFVKFLAAAFDRNLFKSNRASSFEKILRQMLAEGNLDENYLLERLQMVGWNRHDQYVCFKTEPDREQIRMFSVQKLCSTLGIVLKKSFSFPLEGIVCTICNLSLAGYSERTYRSKMDELCAATGATAGASFPFEDFFLFKEYYRQAEKAVTLAQAASLDGRFIPFSDCVLDFIINHSTQEFPPAMICSKAVPLLYQIDQEKGTGFIHTLRCYFHNCCQQTATAQELHIHRSTLTYRLEKIRELTDIDLYDEDARLYLQLSLRLFPSPPELPQT